MTFLISFSFAKEGHAHQLPPKEINRVSEIHISREAVTIDYSLTYYGVAEIEELLKADKDRNGEITKEEKLDYFRERTLDLQKTLYIIINDRMLRPSLVEKIQFSGQPFTQKFKFVIGLSGVVEDENRLLFYDRKYGPLSKKNEVSINYSDNVNVQNIANLDKGFEVCFAARGEVAGYIDFPVLDVDADMVKDVESVEMYPRLALIAGGKVGRLYEKLRFVLSDILSNPNVTTKMMVVSFIIAFILGAIHALTPGHGKTLTSVYIVGAHGTKWQVVLLGFIVALTHTASVILLGIVALFASRYFMPEKIYPWVGFTSGIFIYIIGFWLFIRKGHEHIHEHYKQMDRSLWSIVTLGVIAGAVPCPDALVVLLVGIAINKTVLGFLILLVFGFGVAVVLVGIGMLMVEAGTLTDRFFIRRKTLLSVLPRISAVVIMILGVFIAIRSLMTAGILWLNI